ncbi:heterogeneous nuclear ribonucleoprotein Q-like isoform X2 [Curcuma longa]
MEEEVEYEEIEEEVEEEEEEVVEEEVEEEQEATTANRNNDCRRVSGDAGMVDNEMDAEERKKHEDLLSLPPHGSEIYVGGIPLNASEDELRSFCESAGEVTEVRVMKGKNPSENKGYAFVTFKTAELALKAIEQLNNTEFKNKKVKCSTSQAKNRLFIGNVPRTWSLDDLKKVVTSIGPGVNKVELIKSTDTKNPSHNRGYAFVEYYNHACAEYSRNKMSSPEFKFDENRPTVNWADPRSGDSSSSQVKAIYVKNLPKDVTKEQLIELFELHGEITKVVLLPAKSGHEKRFGFVHFKERMMAMKALQHTQKYEIDGDVLECSLAKPPAESKKPDPASSAQKAALLPNYPPWLGYGVLGGPYGALAPGLPQPMIYGRGQTPAPTMVPMILPDGRLGYVLQQPGIPLASQQHGRNRGSSSSGGSNNDSNRWRRFRPY